MIVFLLFNGHIIVSNWWFRLAKDAKQSNDQTQTQLCPAPFVVSRGMKSPKEVICQHLIAGCDVFKDFQLSQEVVRELHVSNALGQRKMKYQNSKRQILSSE